MARNEVRSSPIADGKRIRVSYSWATGLRHFLCAVSLVIASSGSAQSAVARGTATNLDALVLLETKCVGCHGGDQTKGGLDLRTREGLLRGGETGAAIVAGKPGESLLVRMIRHEKNPGMPHKQPKLPDDAIEQIAKWIADGAPYGRPLNKSTGVASAQSGASTLTDEDRSHWAFQPVKRPTPPAVADPQRLLANPIDRFIAAKLEPLGLSLSPPAPKVTLIRRVNFDLIGLPPTPEEVDAFVNDTSTDAYERLIERLLASPHYGERWGRHWLDLARYAESDGFEHDAARPNAWLYRDYVIRSFNTDKPYDRFIKEQLAGDELAPDDPQALIATGFNLLGPDMIDTSNQAQRRQNTLDDMTDTAGLVFLGMTVGCARCHNHKFEPITQADFFRLQAFFAPSEFRRDLPVADA